MVGNWVSRRSLALAWSASVLTALPALAQVCPELLGRWPYGSVGPIAVSGELAYFASGEALVIADISEPSAPRVVGRVVVPGGATGVAVAGGFAFVVAESEGLRVIDVNEPSAPVEVGFLGGWYSAAGVAVSDGYAYVAVDSGSPRGLRAIDVSTPSAPVEVGHFQNWNYAMGVAVSGRYAYLANCEDGVRVIDISTPSAPVQVGSVDTPDCATSIVVSHPYAYVADDSSGLRVIDVSTPSAPVEVGFHGTGVANEVALDGSHAFVAAGEGGLRVIDVSTPSAPAVVAIVDPPEWGTVRRVAAGGGYAYASASAVGLRVIDMSVPSAPVEVGHIDTVWGAAGVAVAGDHAYMAGDPVRVLDVSAPSAPVEIGAVDLELGAGGARHISVSEGYAYVAREYHGINVVDVSSPSTPVEVAFMDTDATSRIVDLAVEGGRAYVVTAADSSHEERLWIVDVSAPTMPVELGVVDVAEAGGVAVEGSYAYVAWGQWSIPPRHGGLRVIDVSDPSAPLEVGLLDTLANANDVAVADGSAYAGCDGGLRVVDVHDPSARVEGGFLDTNDDVEHVAVADGYAYLGCDPSLRAVDVHSPSAPVEVGRTSPAGDLVAANGNLYVAAGGLRVLSGCAGSLIPNGHESFIPAAALAAGAQGAFFRTDLEINNSDSVPALVYVAWLPRGVDNSEAATSEVYNLAAGESLRFDNVLGELFGLEPDSLGALMLVASTESVIGMSRTYNTPAGKTAGTFGQGLPTVPSRELIGVGETRRILFMSENADVRSNVGCVNGDGSPLRIDLALHDASGTLLETRSMDLAPWSNNQIQRVFQTHQPVIGYIDVSTPTEGGRFACYGSVLDNSTSDPTTVVPQVPGYGGDVFVPAAAFASGLAGAFFQTDLEINNPDPYPRSFRLYFRPRGADTSIESGTFSLAPNASVRYTNVLASVFGLEPDAVGALRCDSNSGDLLAMSRTYTVPGAKAAGTFGQGIPGVSLGQLIRYEERGRILFMNENRDARSNIGCLNDSTHVGDVTVQIELFNSAGESLEVKTMELPLRSNDQITRVFRDYAPITAGYVDVWTTTPGARIYCYGSVLDNETNDPTTVLPQ